MGRISVVVLFTLYFYWSQHFSVKSDAVDVKWNSFATNVIYTNVKLITEWEGFFSPLFFSNEAPVLYRKMECARICALNDFCHAFNFYPAGSAYVCELVPTNLCLTNIRRAFVECPGNQLWEKLSTGTSNTCLEMQFPSLTNIPCEVMRPGCLGYWPNCSNCTKMCRDCYDRNNRPNFHNCTLWSDGDKDWPIFGICFQFKTYLIKQVVDLSTGSKQGSYRMSFYDINRVYRLQAHTNLEFHFITKTGTHHGNSYTKSYVDVNGTLSNVTFIGSFTTSYDMFKLNGVTQARIPFVNVTDDRFGCGSFWLLDPSNATYCPGGTVRMFGTVKMNGGTVTSTGLSYTTLPTSDLVTYASMELA